MITPIDVTKNVFAAFGAHDVDTIVKWLHPDVRIEFYGPEAIPYAGMYNGPDQARVFLTPSCQRSTFTSSIRKSLSVRGTRSWSLAICD